MKISARMVTSVAAAAALALSLAACSKSSDNTSGPDESAGWAKSQGTLVFATVPDKAGSDTNWKPLEDYLQKQTGYTVEFHATADYAALIQAAAAGQVDVASFSGLTYVQAINKGAKLKVASAVIASKGLTDPGYYSEAIVPAGSSITSVAGYQGQTVCFVDPNSTSGFLFPLLALSKAGISVTATGTDANNAPTFGDFTAHFAGSHSNSVAQTDGSTCQAGFAEDSEAEAAQTAGTVTVLDKQYVPGGPLVYSTTLPADVQAKLQSVLNSITLDQISGAGITVTDAFSSGFQSALPKDDSYYDTIRDICKQVPAAKCAPAA